MNERAPANAEAQTGALGRAVTRALGWSALAQVLGRLGNFAVGVVLARLLTKEDFGVYAVALVAINLLIVANDLGVIAAVIRWRDDVRRVAGTAATLSFLSSALLFAAVFAVAPTFADAMGSPRAANLVRVIALAIVVDGCTAVPQALLVRDFRNQRLALAEFTGFLVGTPITVVMALLGAGPWSLVVGRVAGSVAVGISVAMSAPFAIRPQLDHALARRLLRFGTPLAVSAIISQAVLNVDYLVVGRSLGAVELGVYLLAFNLSSWPASLVSTAVARVAFAGFSRLVEDRERLRTALPRSIGVAVSVLMPLVVVLAILAPEVIGFVYGRKWLPAVSALRFLVILGGLRILIDLLIDLAIADGRPRVALSVRLAWLAVLVPALAVGAEVDGIRGVGIGHVAVATLVVVPWLVVDAGRSGIPARALATETFRPALAATAAAAVMLLLLPVVSGDLLRLVVVGGAGSVAYLAVLVPGNPLVPWVLDRVRPARVSSA